MSTSRGPVLVVTAVPKLAEGLRYALGSLEVYCADSSADAVRQLTAIRPRAIVVDLAFPEMDPELFVHRARRCPETARSPVIGLGGPEEPEATWLALGCAAVLDRDAAPQELGRQILLHLGPQV